MDRRLVDRERRRSARRTVAADEPLTRARLRTGGELTVVDASHWGVLTESTVRLLPGRHLDVHVVTADGRVLVRARVARAYVCEVGRDTIRYRAALAFDSRISTDSLPVSDAVGSGLLADCIGSPAQRDRGTVDRFSVQSSRGV